MCGPYSRRLRIEVGNKGITLPYGSQKSLQLLKRKLIPAGFVMSGITEYYNRTRMIRSPSFGVNAMFRGTFDIKVREITGADPHWKSDSDKALETFVKQLCSVSSIAD